MLNIMFCQFNTLNNIWFNNAIKVRLDATQEWQQFEFQCVTSINSLILLFAFWKAIDSMKRLSDLVVRNNVMHIYI